jgi:hypothetical protein
MTIISSEANESDGRRSMASAPLSSLELSKRAVMIYEIMRWSAGCSIAEIRDRGELEKAIGDRTWFPETVPQWEDDEISVVPCSYRVLWQS